MNPFQTALISLALALNAFVAFHVAGDTLRKDGIRHVFKFGLVMLITQFFVSGIGLWLGMRISSISSNSNYYIAIGILLVLGLSILLDSLRIKTDDKTPDLKDMRVILTRSILEATPVLAVSTAVGLTVESAFPSWYILLVFQFLALVTGLFTGSKFGEKIRKIRTGPISGFIMLAAALKLLIDLIGY
jgi:putative Mn2+ efflux pump MntP